LTEDSEYLAIGRIVKPFGVRGEVVVEPLTDDPDRFAALRTVLVGEHATAGRRMKVERVRPTGRGVRLALEGVGDRSAAEGLRGQFLFVPPDERIRLPEGRHFVHTLIGLAVVSEQGEPLGSLVEVLKLPAHDVYVVRGERGEMMIPAVEEFVRRIDPAAGVITVRLIEGMSPE
jgi:16S rRNA processing protein RimM